MHISLVKKAYVLLYLAQNPSSYENPSEVPVTCVFFGEVNPDNIDNTKVLNIVEKYKSCLNSSFQVHSVKIVQGYRFIFSEEAE